MTGKEKVIFGVLVTGVWGSLFCFIGGSLYQSWAGAKIPNVYFASLVIIAAVSIVYAQFFFLPRFGAKKEVRTPIHKAVRYIYHTVCFLTLGLVLLKYAEITFPVYIGNTLVISIGCFSVLEAWVKSRKW